VEEVITVLLADDHPPTRAGVRLSLEDGGFVVVGEASNGREAVEMAVELRPDVCVVDVNMPGLRGPQAVEQIAEQVPSTACVMLTVSQDDEDLFTALRAGAVGYLLKDIDPDRLPDALRGVLRGEAALPRMLVTRLLDEFRSKGKRRISPPGRKAVDLTERELTVLLGLRDGKSTKQIAEELHVAQVTIRSYVHSLLRKLSVPDRAAAVRLFEEST
jgi:two-component system, NarL family, nitrate/nitrite response regulator NarL